LIEIEDKDKHDKRYKSFRPKRSRSSSFAKWTTERAETDQGDEISRKNTIIEAAGGRTRERPYLWDSSRRLSCPSWAAAAAVAVRATTGGSAIQRSDRHRHRRCG
jgi:hypothetical protein